MIGNNMNINRANIDKILEYYYFSVECIENRLKEETNYFIDNASRMYSLDNDEIDAEYEKIKRKYEEEKKEIKYQADFALLSALEGILRNQYNDREWDAHIKDKQRFWRDILSEFSLVVSNDMMERLTQVWDYRHFLAHGRTIHVGIDFLNSEIEEIYDIVSEILSKSNI